MYHHKNVRDLVACYSGEEALNRIQQIYDENANLIRDSFRCFFEDYKDDEEEIQNFPSTSGCYPYIGITVKPENMHIDASLAYGVALEPGVYGTTVTQPALFAEYYKRQLDLLIEHHKIPIYVGVSDAPIPFPFVAEDKSLQIEQEAIWKIGEGFVLPNLSRVNDEIVNNTYAPGPDDPQPLSLFTAERVDFSLSRLHHYTGTSPAHFQGFILLTNYQRYVNEFIEYSKSQVRSSQGYNAFVEPGDVVHTADTLKAGDGDNQPQQPPSLPQMPAYHLKREDGMGITMINIGVGPTNAKTITDHLAVLRPHCWLMIGHCAGLRRSQMLGDYVLAHAYVRLDHVLDEEMPTTFPIPALAEIQVALQDAVGDVTGKYGLDMKSRMRTGTVVTVDNRNWEFLSKSLFYKFNQNRAIGLDMESATIACNGFRYRVPYGTLLCVSDKPIHGEIKMKSMAQKFFSDHVSQHLKIAINAVGKLRDGGTRNLHSRKLRGFDEPPFR